MGTSASSKGPGAGVSFDPPWLDNIVTPAPVPNVPVETPQTDVESPHDTLPVPPEHQPEPESIAPTRRFTNARRALNSFVQTGRKIDFNKAAGHYSRTGMGGARNVARRMRAATKTGASVFGLLRSAREGTDPSVNEWVSSLAHRNANAQEVADEIIRRAVPAGGSQDETACQDSMAQALQDLIAENETVDLLHLSDNDIWALLESFLGYEAFTRMYLDVGQIFESTALSPREQVERMIEMQEYLKADIGLQIERLREQSRDASASQLQSIMRQALESTFAVYEGAI